MRFREFESRIRALPVFNLNDVCKLDANLLDHYACQILALFFGRPFPILARGLRLALAIGRPRKTLAIGDS